MELEALTEAKEKDSVLEIQCNYRNVINAQSEFLKTTAVIDRPDNVVASAPINTYVDKQRNRIIAAKAMEQVRRCTRLNITPFIERKLLVIMAIFYSEFYLFG